MNCAPKTPTRSPKNLRAGAAPSMSEDRTVCASDSQRFRAKKMDQVPRVTMNGGKRNRVIRSPFRKPQAVPVARPAASASSTGRPWTTPIRPIATELNTMIAATERSMPAERMIRVWATPRIPITVTCWMIREKLKGVKKPLAGGESERHQAQDEHHERRGGRVRMQEPVEPGDAAGGAAVEGHERIAASRWSAAPAPRRSFRATLRSGNRSGKRAAGGAREGPSRIPKRHGRHRGKAQPQHCSSPSFDPIDGTPSTG